MNIIDIIKKHSLTTDFSKAEKGMPLHKITGSELTIDKIVCEDGKHIPMVAGVLFRDYAGQTNIDKWVKKYL
jgi:hypothetical protein